MKKARSSPSEKRYRSQSGVKIEIVTVGRAARGWPAEGQQEYVTRLRGAIDIQWRWLRDDDALIDAAEQQKHPAWALDERGKLMTSTEFSTLVSQAGARLTFFIGGAAGLPPAIRERFPLISLSRMTFPHQIAHLLLVEQLYRAHEIARGHPYHK